MSVPVPNLAAEIEREHQATIGAVQTAIEHAVVCGGLLIEAKAGVGHGDWLAWLESNTTISARQSQRYMRLGRAVIDGKCDATSFLTIDQALAALATPRAEPEHPVLAGARAIAAELDRIRSELDALNERLDAADTANEASAVYIRANELLIYSRALTAKVSTEATRLWGELTRRLGEQFTYQLMAAPEAERGAMIEGRLTELYEATGDLSLEAALALSGVGEA
jgi:hypothetical protein